MTNRELRRALLEKLNITQQALSLRVQKLKNQHPITTEDATYVIAQGEGIILDKYLDIEEVDRIRDIIKHLQPVTQFSEKNTSKRKRVSPTTKHTTIQIANEFKINDPILSVSKLNESKEMAAIYPLLYILENSIREFIDKKMTSLHGSNWWDSHSTKPLRETVAKRTTNENKNSWHQRRGSRPIDYLDLNQLVPLVRKIETDVVPDIIPSIDWFSQLVEEVYLSRCVLCHMNPLDKDNIQSVKLRFRQWQKQIKAKAALIT